MTQKREWKDVYRDYEASVKERDDIEQAIADDPLWAAQEIVDVKRALEQIASLAHEDGSSIAHKALQSPLFTRAKP